MSVRILLALQRQGFQMAVAATNALSPPARHAGWTSVSGWLSRAMQRLTGGIAIGTWRRRLWRLGLGEVSGKVRFSLHRHGGRKRGRMRLTIVAEHSPSNPEAQGKRCAGTCEQGGENRKPVSRHMGAELLRYPDGREATRRFPAQSASQTQYLQRFFGVSARGL